MNGVFQSYVTSHAFVLVLSRPQIEALAWCAMNDKQQNAYPSVPYAMTMDSLTRRGLITRSRITEEGKLVLQLCRRAGLVEIALKVAA